MQFVLNYEEGGENSVLHGDAGSEPFLSEIIGAPAYRGAPPDDGVDLRVRLARRRVAHPARVRAARACRSPCSASRWRCERHPELAAAFVELGHEIACHGWRWIHYQHVDEATEREHMRARSTRIARADRRSAPLGWYTGRDSPNTRRLVVEHGGFDYDSDYYGDDLPFWLQVDKTDGARVPHLVVPYTLDTNDMRFAPPQGFNTGDALLRLPARRFDVLYAEGDETRRRCCRSACTAACSAGPGRIARAAALSRPRRARTTASGSAAASTSRGTGSAMHPFDRATAFAEQATRR